MAELAPSPSSIAADHAEIINGVEAIYGTLIELEYVENTDVQVPPHGLPKDPIAVAPLRSAGLEPKTIELIGRLPCFTNEIIERQRQTSNSRDGIAIAPFSSATSYLLGSGRHDEAREMAIGQDGDLLPSTAFKLATTTSSEGYNIAYDLSDKTIIKWRSDDWEKCQRFPVAEFMNEWLRQLRSLEWLPWYDDFGWEIEERQEVKEDELADSQSTVSQHLHSKLEHMKSSCESTKPTEDLFAHHVLIQKAAHNRYWARRHMYERCGWPKSFDKDEYSKQRNQWNSQTKELGASAASKGQQAIGDADDCKDLRQFYRSGAGTLAI